MLKLNSLSALPLNTLRQLLDTLRFIKLSLRPRSALAAENLSLRKHLALYLERKAKPQRANDAARLTLVLLSRLFAWRQLLTIVNPHTFIRCHRQAIPLFWRWKSKRRGQPRIPPEVQQLIPEIAQRNPTWGEERIAAEFLLKLGIRVSPRTVTRYMPDDTRSQRGPSSQRWMTFVRNHAQGILACDFFVAITATFRVFHVFVVLEVGTRRIAHFNVTAHPTADCTLQQFRQVITGETPVSVCRA